MDDPNRQLFGSVSNNGSRRLTAEVKWDKKRGRYTVGLKYVRYGGERARGLYVTFITYPGFGGNKEDSYELFAPVDEQGVAEEEIYPAELFTVAAVGDGGDTALTLDLEELE